MFIQFRAHRHLLSAGWTVVVVPFYEWNSLYDKNARATYLRQKLLKCMGRSDGANDDEHINS